MSSRGIALQRVTVWQAAHKTHFETVEVALPFWFLSNDLFTAKVTRIKSIRVTISRIIDCNRKEMSLRTDPAEKERIYVFS
jgi:hypothetical protein